MVNASISEIYDLSTKVGQGTVLKIHTPNGNNIKRHLMGYFLQYKKFKYLGAKVTLVPASTLPADPLQLSYEAGEPTIDPRDMVNPILWRHYHGEAMLTDSLVKSYPDSYDYPVPAHSDVLGTSVDSQDYTSGAGDINLVYPLCLMDPSFKKAGIQAGFTTYVKPYAYNLVTTAQVLGNRSFTSGDSVTWAGSRKDVLLGDGTDNVSAEPLNDGKNNFVAGSSPSVFTNKLTPLGWMDTVTKVWNSSGTTKSAWPSPWADGTDTGSGTGGPDVGGSFGLQSFLPNLSMLYVMLPPAYKSLFYFRLVIKHQFAFSGFRSCINVQSFGSASMVASMAYAPTTSASTVNMISDLVADSADGGPDSVIVENGDIINTADGVL